MSKKHIEEPIRDDAADSTPHALYEPQGSHPSIREMVQMYVRTAVSQAATQQGLGSFEEEDDFEEDDPDQALPFEVLTASEIQAMEPEELEEMLDGVPEPVLEAYFGKRDPAEETITPPVETPTEASSPEQEQ